MGGTTKFRIGHAGAAFGNSVGFQKVKRQTTCTPDKFYLAPTVSQSVNSMEKLEIKWDASCLSPESGNVDIYLYAPATSKPLLHMFRGVPNAEGQYSAEVMPRWWNATSDVKLNLAIVESGKPTFQSPIGPGPQFTATYSAPSDGTLPAEADTSKVDNGVTAVTGQGATAAVADNTAPKGLSGGKVAAAVIVPILFVGAIAILAYLRMQRQKRQESSQRYSAAIDRRMSAISSDWKPAPGGSPMMQASDSSARFSTFSWSNGARPASSVNAVEGGAGGAGMGAQGFYHQQNSSIANYDYVNGYQGGAAHHQPRQLSQSTNVMRPSFSTSRVSFADGSRPHSQLRQSRISFAESTRVSRYSTAGMEGARPSVDSRRSLYSQATMPGSGERSSRAYHTSFNVSTDAPPVPAVGAKHDSDTLGKNAAGLLSPKQTAGPLTLREEDITRGATMSVIGADIDGALAMMQTSTQSAELLFAAPQTPGPEDKRMSIPSVPPQAAYAPPASPRIQQQTSPLGPMPMLSPQASFEIGGTQSPNGNGEKYMSPDEMLAAYARSKQQQQQRKLYEGYGQESDAYGGTA